MKFKKMTPAEKRGLCVPVDQSLNHPQIAHVCSKKLDKDEKSASKRLNKDDMLICEQKIMLSLMNGE